MVLSFQGPAEPGLGASGGPRAGAGGGGSRRPDLPPAALSPLLHTWGFSTISSPSLFLYSPPSLAMLGPLFLAPLFLCLSNAVFFPSRRAAPGSRPSVPLRVSAPSPRAPLSPRSLPPRPRLRRSALSSVSRLLSPSSPLSISPSGSVPLPPPAPRLFPARPRVSVPPRPTHPRRRPRRAAGRARPARRAGAAWCRPPAGRAGGNARGSAKIPGRLRVSGSSEPAPSRGPSAPRGPRGAQRPLGRRADVPAWAPARRGAALAPLRRLGAGRRGEGDGRGAKGEGVGSRDPSPGPVSAVSPFHRPAGQLRRAEQCLPPCHPSYGTGPAPSVGARLCPHADKLFLLMTWHSVWH